MHYAVILAERAAEIEATPVDQDGSTCITVDGEPHRVTVSSPSPHRVAITLAPDAEPIGGAQRQTALVARSAEGTWVWVGGRARLVRPRHERRRAGRGAAAGAGQTVTPPMPAIVSKVLVEPGQMVEQGQALVVVSAMKMEMTLTAPYGGTVRAVHTQPGAKANPGDELVEIEPQSGPGAR